MQAGQGSDAVLVIEPDRRCRYCGEPLPPHASVCRVCAKYQNRMLELLSPLVAVLSAVTGLALLGVAYNQLKQSSAELELARAAKSQAEVSEKTARDASARLTDLVSGAEATSRRLTAVEGVLTQVDVASGGRKLCFAYRNPTWGEMRDGNLGDVSLYVPASWTATACRDQAVKLGSDRFRLGCVFKDRASVGPFTSTASGLAAALPIENCGW